MTVLILFSSRTANNISPMAGVSAFRGSADFVEWAYLLTDRMRAVSLLFSIIMFIRALLLLGYEGWETFGLIFNQFMIDTTSSVPSTDGKSGETV